MNDRILLTACGSGSGKTTVMCALLAALRGKMRVAAFKCGPDYIDPMFHNALGTPCTNLDTFFCGGELLTALFEKHSQNADISLIEGVMGYYDGLDMCTTAASSYEVARTLGCPAVLVINARGMAASVLALIRGMAEYKPDSGIKGVILNNVSAHVFKALAPEIEKTGIAALGFLPRDERFVLESRHLGLVTPAELDDIAEKMRLLGEAAEKYIDIERLLKIAHDSVSAPAFKAAARQYPASFAGLKIAVAMDRAFCFYYRDGLEMLEECGCETVYFSPLDDTELPRDIDGLIIGGGYPEVYAEKLSANSSMLLSVKTALESGLPALAECGGFMYLQKTLDNGRGVYPMVGFIDAAAENKGRPVRFGYVTLTNAAGDKIKAHEFHYFDSTDNGAEFTAEKPSGKSWKCMHIKNNCICGYPHIFYPANEKFLYDFLDKCKKRRRV